MPAFGRKRVGERLRGVDNDRVISGDILEPESVAKAVVDHETDVVVGSEILKVSQCLGLLLGMNRIVLVAGEFIHIPHCPGKESADPIPHRNENHLAVLDGRRKSDCVAFFRFGDEPGKLLLCKADVVVHDVILRSAGKNGRGKKSESQKFLSHNKSVYVIKL